MMTAARTPEQFLEYALTQSTRLDSGCLVWNRSTIRTGYVRVRVSGAKWLLHRLSYAMSKGDIGDKEVGHKCHDESDCTEGDNCVHRRCWEPSHLVLQTHAENSQAGHGNTVAFAAKTHCRRGHPYDADNLYEYRGMRYCRACRRINHGRPD